MLRLHLEAGVLHPFLYGHPRLLCGWRRRRLHLQTTEGVPVSGASPVGIESRSNVYFRATHVRGRPPLLTDDSPTYASGRQGGGGCAWRLRLHASRGAEARIAARQLRFGSAGTIVTSACSSTETTYRLP